MASKKRKGIPDKDWKILIAESGGYCAFPGCPEYLVSDDTETDLEEFLGEIAHIVGSSRQGPRGDSLLSDEDRNRHPNLVMLCDKHHKIVDRQIHHYSIPVMIQMKLDQKNRNKPGKKKEEPFLLRSDKIFSTLLPVTHLPQTVFSAPCKFSLSEKDELKDAIVWPKHAMEIAPHIIHGGELYTFHDLRNRFNPFAKCVDYKKVELTQSQEFWSVQQGQHIFMRLLNSSLYKYCARLNVRFDRMHNRFYFPVEKLGEERTASYRPMNATKSALKVAWNPVTKATGEGKKYWLHRAAKLRFHIVASKEWVLSIRPERHVTIDGITHLPPEKVGPVVTRQKARMYNEGYLTEVHFWRDFLSNSRPRLILDYGQQSTVISTTLQTFEVDWPGIEGDDKPYKNQELEDDLFSLMDFERSISGLPPEEFTPYDEDFEDDEDDESIGD